MTRSVSLYISQTLLRLKFAPAELSVSSILHVDAKEVRQHYYWKEIWKHDKDMLGGLYKIPTATWSRHKFYIQLMDASYKGSGQKYFGGVSKQFQVVDKKVDTYKEGTYNSIHQL